MSESKLIPPNPVPKHLREVDGVVWPRVNCDVEAWGDADWRSDATVRHVDDDRLVVLIKVLDRVPCCCRIPVPSLPVHCILGRERCRQWISKDVNLFSPGIKSYVAVRHETSKPDISVLGLSANNYYTQTIEWKRIPSEPFCLDVELGDGLSEHLGEPHVSINLGDESTDYAVQWGGKRVDTIKLLGSVIEVIKCAGCC